MVLPKNAASLRLKRFVRLFALPAFFVSNMTGLLETKLSPCDSSCGCVQLSDSPDRYAQLSSARRALQRYCVRLVLPSRKHRRLRPRAENPGGKAWIESSSWQLLR